MGRPREDIDNLVRVYGADIRGSDTRARRAVRERAGAGVQRRRRLPGHRAAGDETGAVRPRAAEHRDRDGIELARGTFLARTPRCRPTAGGSRSRCR
ncbi:MAG: hypothetical protein U0470_00430 [Anaerolineae bacterium]